MKQECLSAIDFSCCFCYTSADAGVVKLADTLALEASAFWRRGSNPLSGTAFIHIYITMSSKKPENIAPRSRPDDDTLGAEKSPAAIDQKFVDSLKGFEDAYYGKGREKLSHRILFKEYASAFADGARQIEEGTLPEDYMLLNKLRLLFCGIGRSVRQEEQLERGRLVSDDEKNLVDRVFQKIKKRCWEMYKNQRSDKNSSDPERPPTTIDQNFIDYLEALQNNFDDFEGLLDRFVECCRLILENPLPENSNFLLNLGPELLGNLMKKIGHTVEYHTIMILRVGKAVVMRKKIEDAEVLFKQAKRKVIELSNKLFEEERSKREP